MLLLLLHHIAGDGWSLAPLPRDLGRAYEARLAGGAPAWPALPVQYADYTLWQHAVLGAEEDGESAIARQLAFWTERAGGASGSDRSADRPGAACGGEPSRRAACPLTLPAALHGGLLALGARERGEPVHGAAGRRWRRC